jgi:hypothetical protein
VQQESRRRVRVRHLLILALTVALAAPPAAFAGGADATTPQFVDGTWSGSLDYTGAVDTLGVSALAGGSGTFEMNVAAGQSTGTFQFLAQGASTSATASASADLTFGTNGSVAGDATKPVLDPQAAQISGTAQAQGFEVPIDFAVGSESLVDAPLSIYAASCNQVTGDFTQEFAGSLSAAGVAATIKGYFVAVRTGSAPEAAVDTLNALLNKLDSVLEAAQTGGVTVSAVIDVVKEAEAFAAAIPKNTKCGIFPKSGQFQLAITAKIADLLDMVIEFADQFTTDELIQLMWAGVQVGAIGAGSADQEFSDKVLGNLENILTERLEQAVTDKNQEEIDAVLEAAITFGFTDLAKLAAGS